MGKHEELPIPVFSSHEPVYGDGSQVKEAHLHFDNFKSKFSVTLLTFSLALQGE